MQPAVFAKNHPEHLKGAADIASTDAAQLVTFRSSKIWVGANRLLERLGRGTVPVLFAVVGDGPVVRYRALLQELKLSPTPGDPRTEDLLRLRPPSTREEDPWRYNTKTLYVISGCRELKSPVPYGALLKQSDEQPLRADFGYSYALVNVAGSGGEPGPPIRVASDIAAPPARIEAVVTRIVRDTSSTRQLKQLHDHRCQICSTRLSLSASQAYSEAHHMKPLGRPHSGPDIAENILVLCPNCHVLCDHSAIALARETLRTVPEHQVGDEFLAYHNQLAASRKAI